MSNTTDITRPSYIGIPNCINETVSITNDLAQCVGTNARWPSAVRRSMTGEVAGECYKTDTALPETVNMIKHGQLIQARLTAEEVTADRVGRAVTQYRYRLQEGVPYLPQKDKLVCLYVPRWQDEQGDVLYDLSGNDYHLTRTAGTVTWHDNGSVTVSATGAMAFQGETQAVNEHTMLADRQGWRRKSSSGNIIANYNGFKTRRDSTSINVFEISRTGNQMHTYSNRRDNTVTQYADETRAWITRRRSDYCGHNINYNDETNTPNRIVLGGGYGSSGSLWGYVWCVAMWSASLTDMEIQVAQMYLAQQSRPADL